MSVVENAPAKFEVGRECLVWAVSEVQKTKRLLADTASASTGLRRSNKLTFFCRAGLRAYEVDYLAQPRMTRASTKATKTNIAIDSDDEATIAA